MSLARVLRGEYDTLSGSRRSVRGVVVDAAGFDDIGQATVKTGRAIEVLELCKGHQNGTGLVEVTRHERGTGKWDETVATPVFVEPRQPGVSAITALTGHE